MSQSIMIAEDDPNILLSLEFLLKQAGYEVAVARDGDEALLRLADVTPDLIVLDVMMPKRNGYDVCTKVRADSRFDNTRILMLTARGRDAERERGLAAGADDYLTKPFSTRDMLDRVRRMLAPVPSGP